MSRLRELIAELCPDGVEYKPLNSLVVKPSAIRWKSETGTRRYIDLTSVDIATHRIGETIEVDATTAPSRARQIVSVDDVLFATTRPTQMRYCIVPASYDNEVCSTGYCVLRAKRGVIEPHFLYHLLGTNPLRAYLEMRQTEGNYPAISDKDLKSYAIPIPPIEVQREIVRILDAMQELDDALTAEIEAREKQLNSVRASIYSGSSHPVASLGEVGQFERGKRFTRAQMGGTGIPCIHYGDIYTKCRYWAKDPIDRLVEDTSIKLRFACKGDVVIATTSENAEDVCEAILWDCDEDAAVHDDCQIFHHNQNPLYMALFFNSEPFVEQKMRFITESKVVRVSGSEMAQITIPLPPKEIQDTFADNLADIIHLIDCLREERTARRKQFAYYRDKLLAFPEKGR